MGPAPRPMGDRARGVPHRPARRVDPSAADAGGSLLALKGSRAADELAESRTALTRLGVVDAGVDEYGAGRARRADYRASVHHRRRRRPPPLPLPAAVERRIRPPPGRSPTRLRDAPARRVGDSAARSAMIVPRPFRRPATRADHSRRSTLNPGGALPVTMSTNLGWPSEPDPGTGAPTSGLARPHAAVSRETDEAARGQPMARSRPASGASAARTRSTAHGAAGLEDSPQPTRTRRVGRDRCRGCRRRLAPSIPRLWTTRWTKSRQLPPLNGKSSHREAGDKRCG